MVIMYQRTGFKRGLKILNKCTNSNNHQILVHKQGLTQGGGGRGFRGG